MKEYLLEINAFFVKIILPAMVGISIKLAVQVKREKMTFFRVVLSFITGIGCVYFAYPFVETIENKRIIPALLGIVAMSGEKITEFIIYKWNIDYFLTSLINAFRDFLIKMIK